MHIHRNMEARSSNHSCRAKAVSLTNPLCVCLCVCVSVALVMRHAKRMRHGIVVCKGKGHRTTGHEGSEGG